MGALTSNRKRGDDYFSFNQTFQSLYSSESDRLDDFHVSKKPRVSSMCLSPDRPSSSKSTASRIHRYPEPIQRLRREVHAPCRITKFGFLASSGREWRRRVSEKEGSVDVMGNALSNQYDLAKSRAFDAFRYFKKDKEVIDVDTEPERDGVSDDSSIEDLEIVEDGREGRSVVSGQRSREINGAAVANVEELDEKVAGHGLHPSSSSAVSDSSNANMKVDNAGKMLDSLSLNRELDVAGVPIHKKLLEFAGRRNSTLSSLSFQIDLNEKRWFSLRSLRSLRPATKPVEDVLREPFVPLTEEEEAEVSRLFSNSNRRNVLVAHENSNIEITGEKLQCLRPGAWLNDEVINLYLELLKEREKREPKKYLKCHFFNTFFYKKLISGRNGYDFKSIRRWTTQKKLGYGLIECDKIFVPIHKEIHWCLAVINKKDEKFQYLDSLKGMDTQVLKVLARYFVDEVKDKSGKDINVSSWKQEYVEDLPEQENGWDCGMFMIKYADFYSRDVGLCFNQEHMPYFRLRTAKEILRLKAD